MIVRSGYLSGTGREDYSAICPVTPSTCCFTHAHCVDPTLCNKMSSRIEVGKEFSSYDELYMSWRLSSALLIIPIILEQLKRQKDVFEGKSTQHSSIMNLNLHVSKEEKSILENRQDKDPIKGLSVIVARHRLACESYHCLLKGG